ncbi:MAG: exopolysaccharide biosynthesis polyprenyl glycosylphosphotransferase [Bacteroidota bacterium]
MEKYTNNYVFLAFKVVLFSLEASLMFLASWLAYFLVRDWGILLSDYYLSWCIIFSLSWVAISAVQGQYESEVIFDRKILLRKQPYTFFLHILLNFIIISAYSETAIRNNEIFLSYGFAMLFIFSQRLLVSIAYKYRRLLFKDYKVVIVGSGATANALFNFFTGKMTKVYRLWENTDKLSPGNTQNEEEISRQIRKVKDFCTRNDVKEIYCTLPISHQHIIEEISAFADNNYIRFKLANDFNLLNQKDITVYFYDQTPIITLRKDPLASWSNRIIKRAFDILFSSLVLIFIFPPMLLFIGLAIKLSSPGPLFFRQVRSGRKNQEFKCFKFRTMVHGADKKNNEYVQATKGDPRITRIGAFLRRTSLDEFPQFINVFLGHMSVVGPRPHPLPLNDIYAKKIQNYFFRYYITPGITGFAQTQGYRGETASDPEKMKRRVELDLWYIQHWSLLLDIKIILKTFISVFKGDENAY